MIRIQMPAINDGERQKNARVVVVKNDEEAAPFLEQGGVILVEEDKADRRADPDPITTKTTKAHGK